MGREQFLIGSLDPYYQYTVLPENARFGMVRVILNEHRLVCRSQGGLRAVVWTDAFQMTVLYIGLVVMIAIGAAAVGGPGVVFERALEGGRFNFLKCVTFTQRTRALHVLVLYSTFQTFHIMISKFTSTGICCRQAPVPY